MLWILYLVTFIVVSQPETSLRNWNEIFSSNEWTPITRERVFSGLQRKGIGLESAQDIYNRNQNNVADIGNNEEIIQKMFRPRYVNYNADWNQRGSFDKNKLNETESNEENFEKIVSNNGGYRKPKGISINYSTQAINSLASADIDKLADELDHEPKEESIEDASANRYEVTETSEVEELLRQQGYININFNTSDQNDKLNKTEKVNLDNTNYFSSKFLSILSNYNIRVNDDLPNYELSRNLKRNPPKQEFVLLPVPVRYSSKFNNLNSFGLDPRLVVFLSNYGYYFPGRFGPRYRYHNLYGHLASNNPFGPYKVYSDTDSSQ